MSPEKSALITKVICGVFIALSYVVANSQTPILDMMSYSWGIISGSFLAPYMLSLYWKGLNRAGAWAGMVGGFLTAAPPVVCKLFFQNAEIPGLDKVANLGPHFACAAMVISIILTVTVSAVFLAARLPGSDTNPEFYTEDAALEETAGA
jgi:SSS family solute:Na+ symporter/sodium/proline symporter